jgi:putative Mg2+ transporter-C (MgtC) family protein
MSILDFVLRLGAALLMGAVVGLERQWRQRMAGMRTNALVSAGAAAFVICAFIIYEGVSSRFLLRCGLCRRPAD